MFVVDGFDNKNVNGPNLFPVIGFIGFIVDVDDRSFQGDAGIDSFGT